MMFSNDHHHPHHNIFLRHLGASQMLWLSSSPPMQSSSPSHFHLLGIHLKKKTPWKKYTSKNTPEKIHPEKIHLEKIHLKIITIVLNCPGSDQSPFTKPPRLSPHQIFSIKENDHPQKNDHHPPQKFTILKKMMNIIKKIIQTCGHCIQTHWLRTLLVCRLKKCESEIEKEQNFLGQCTMAKFQWEL